MRKPYELERAVRYLAAIFMLMTALPVAAQTGAERNRWSLSLHVRESRHLDQELNGQPIDDRIVDSAGASLGFSTRTQRAGVGLFGRVGTNVYRERDFQDRLTFGGGFHWNYQTSQRSRMNLSQSVSKNLRLETLSTLGVLPSDASTLSARTRWGFQHQSGPRTSWGTSVGYGYTKFDFGAPVEGSQLVLDEQPFVDDFPIPPLEPSDPGEVELPEAEDDILRILATEGLDEPRQESHYASASVGLNHSFTQKTTFGFNVGGGYRTIDSSRARQGAPRRSREGASGTLQAHLQRAIGVASATSVGYSFQRSLILDPDTTIQTLFAGWSYSPTRRRLTARLAAGASRFEAQGVPARTSPVAEASLAGALSSSTTAGVSFRRQFSMSFGFGRSLLINYLNANLAQQFGSRVRANVVAGASIASNPLVEDSRFESRRAGGSVTVNIIGGLAAGTAYHYVENERTGAFFSVFDDRRRHWSVYLRYSTNW